ncbi:hypothetical protein [Burkholderia vietnamiensis]|uniref:hypothetical protein n=1 Tax=Burkholderia vietnamiensis TaxID=60552 RepID=UPI000A414BEA|nr:hypothetical protein [Burkholderia vietnamiensis]
MTELQKINLGTAPAGTDGDTIRTAMDKLNANVAVHNTQATLTSTPVTTARALTSAYMGKRVKVNLSAPGTLNWPSANTCSADQIIQIVNVGTATVTMAVSPGSGDTAASVTIIRPGESASYDTDGVGTWSCLTSPRGTLAAKSSVLDADLDSTSVTYDRAHFITRPTDSSFAATGSGTADDTAALNAWLASLAAAGITAACLKPGTYKYNPASLIIPAGVHVYGPARGRAVLLLAGDGDGITIQADARLSDVYLSATAPRASGSMIVLAGNGAQLDNFEMDSYFVGVKAYGASTSSLLVAPAVRHGLLRTPSTTAGGGAFDVNNYSSGDFSHLVVTGSGTGAQPSFGLRIGHGDTFLLTSVNITQHGTALLSAPTSGQTCFSLLATTCLFDNNHNSSGHSAALTPQSGGAVKNARFVNSWFGYSASASGCFMQGAGTGIVDGVEFNGCDFFNCGDSGLRVDGANVKNWSVLGGNSAGNTVGGINVSGGSTDFTIMGHTAGNVSGRGANAYGIIVQGGSSDHYVITGNRVRGNTTSQVSDSGTGTNKYVSNNPA